VSLKTALMKRSRAPADNALLADTAAAYISFMPSHEDERKVKRGLGFRG